MELFRALASLAEPPGPEHRRLAGTLGLPGEPDAAAYTELFVLQLYPYASVFLGAEGMLGGEARDRVAGFWRALGTPPPPEPDHLAALLAGYASLADGEKATREAGNLEAAGRWGHARRAFWWEHLASWLFPWLARAAELADPFYAAWADLLRHALAAEAPAETPASPPLALREAPPPAAEPEPAGAGPLDALLAPARSGVLLTRRDLARLAGELGLGLRQGERRFALRALLGQDPAGVTAWLAAEARRQAALWRSAADAPRPIVHAWASRAEATAAALGAAAARPDNPSVLEVEHAGSD